MSFLFVFVSLCTVVALCFTDFYYLLHLMLSILLLKVANRETDKNARHYITSILGERKYLTS